MQAESRPRANSANAGAAIGSAIACRTAASASANGALSDVSKMPARLLSGMFIGNVPCPYRILICISDFPKNLTFFAMHVKIP